MPHLQRGKCSRPASVRPLQGSRWQVPPPFFEASSLKQASETGCPDSQSQPSPLITHSSNICYFMSFKNALRTPTRNSPPLKHRNFASWKGWLPFASSCLNVSLGNGMPVPLPGSISPSLSTQSLHRIH